MKYFSQYRIHVCKNDISKEYFKLINSSGIVACDIETSGLDWSSDRIGTCQLFSPNGYNQIVIVKIGNKNPKYLSSILENKLIEKIFHHAMFDLRFMCFYWKIQPCNIKCTKIASKLLDVQNKENHHLVDLLEKYIGIKIEKDQMKSDWFSDNLTIEQKIYAANDVYYLIPLFNFLKEKLKSQHLLDVANECFNHIPTRLKLEISGYKDIYTY